jgi:hypothetical protein
MPCLFGYHTMLGGRVIALGPALLGRLADTVAGAGRVEVDEGHARAVCGEEAGELISRRQEMHEKLSGLLGGWLFRIIEEGSVVAGLRELGRIDDSA